MTSGVTVRRSGQLNYRHHRCPFPRSPFHNTKPFRPCGSEGFGVSTDGAAKLTRATALRALSRLAIQRYLRMPQRMTERWRRRIGRCVQLQHMDLHSLRHRSHFSVSIVTTIKKPPRRSPGGLPDRPVVDWLKTSTSILHRPRRHSDPSPADPVGRGSADAILCSSRSTWGAASTLMRERSQHTCRAPRAELLTAVSA